MRKQMVETLCRALIDPLVTDRGLDKNGNTQFRDMSEILSTFPDATAEEIGRALEDARASALCDALEAVRRIDWLVVGATVRAGTKATEIDVNTVPNWAR